MGQKCSADVQARGSQPGVRSSSSLSSQPGLWAVGRQGHKCRALSTQGLPLRKPKVCAELADLEKGISQSAEETKPLFQHTRARRSHGWAQCLAQVPGSSGSLDAAWMCSHLESTEVALWWPSVPFWHPLPRVVARQRAARAAPGPHRALLQHIPALPAC